MGRRLLALLGGAAVAAVAVGAFSVVGSARSREPEPRLLFVQDVPADVRSETDTTAARFRRRFAERTACVGDVSIELVRAVDDGDARYVADERRIEIQIPTTPARYRESLAHELAHHIERTCDEFAALQAALVPVFGADGLAWSEGPTWHETPSERFAETVVELVNGERVRHVETVPIDPVALELIARWGIGAPLAAGE